MENFITVNSFLNIKCLNLSKKPKSADLLSNIRFIVCHIISSNISHESRNMLLCSAKLTPKCDGLLNKYAIPKTNVLYFFFMSKFYFWLFSLK